MQSNQAVAFNQRSWDERTVFMGDTAEMAFTKVAAQKGWKVTRLGFEKVHGLDSSKISMLVRKQPDFLVQGKKGVAMMEVKGTGRDGVLKLKVDDLPYLSRWHLYQGVCFFIFDSHRHRYALVPWPKMERLLDKAPLNYFHDGGGLYYVLKHGLFTWSEYRGEKRATGIRTAPLTPPLKPLGKELRTTTREKR